MKSAKFLGLALVFLPTISLVLSGCGGTASSIKNTSSSAPVNSPAPTTSPASAVTISSPASGDSVSSPFTLSAMGTVCASQTINSMSYAIDTSAATTVSGTSVNTQIAASPGAHTVNVIGHGATGEVCNTSVSIIVTQLAPVQPSQVPSNAITVSSLQALSNWNAANDSAASGSSTGATALVTSPALSSYARRFVTSFANAGNERYWVSFGNDTSAQNFFYDASVYIENSNANVANLEFDMNQVMANGQTVIFGFQCDGYSSTWDYTENAGTPSAPIDHWLHSAAACNPRQWAPNTWHHIQVSYSRDNSGNATYKSVWFDGVEQQINATVPAAFALGWSPTLLTNFQVDGLGTGTNTVYLDNVSVARW